MAFFVSESSEPLTNGTEMTVYQVWDWDPMASNWGDEYLEGIYSERPKAEKRAAELNRVAREHWMQTARIPEGKANYRDRAHVVVTDVR